MSLSRFFVLRGLAINFSSVRVRLIAAFSVVSGLTICAAAVSYFAFGNIGNSLQVVTEEATPAISNALRLSELSKELAAAIPTLTAASNAKQLKLAAQALTNSEENLDTQMDLVEASADDQAAVDRLRSIGVEISGQLGALNKQMSLRLALREKRTTATARIADILGKFLEAVSPIINKANVDLVVKADDAMDEVADALEELGQGEMTELRMVLQFQADANLAFGLLREGAAATNSEELGFTQGKFVEVIATLEESLEDMADDGEAKGLLGMALHQPQCLHASGQNGRGDGAAGGRRFVG